jgi:acylphosphatase
MTIARHYVIGGRVQGVGFRYFVYEAAQREHITGWVRNLHDGRVEAFAEGDAGAVMRFEAQVRQGPSLSRVGSFDVEESKPAAAASFEIRPTSIG